MKNKQKPFLFAVLVQLLFNVNIDTFFKFLQLKMTRTNAMLWNRPDSAKLQIFIELVFHPKNVQRLCFLIKWTFQTRLSWSTRCQKYFGKKNSNFFSNGNLQHRRKRFSRKVQRNETRRVWGRNIFSESTRIVLSSSDELWKNKPEIKIETEEKISKGKVWTEMIRIFYS